MYLLSIVYRKELDRYAKTIKSERPRPSLLYYNIVQIIFIIQ